MYAVLLDYRRRHQLRDINKAHQFVMRNIQRAIQNCGIENQRQGICDLTIGDRKVSGNALRCKKNWLIYHGTLICRDMDLTQIQRCLGMPSREPEYRQRRAHSEFMTRIPVDTKTLADSLVRIWNCEGAATDWPADLTQSLVDEKYTNDSWNRKI
jgi:lipoate-protein ligase A